MPVLDSYLFFDGTCADAMKFYEQTLGAKMQMLLTYKEGPPPCPPGSEDRVMHASISVDGRMLMASDSPAGQHRPMQGFSLSLGYTDADEARRVFALLAEGGSVMMPMDKTFWAEAFGMLTDKFGTPWMVSGGGQG